MGFSRQGYWSGLLFSSLHERETPIPCLKMDEDPHLYEAVCDATFPRKNFLIPCGLLPRFTTHSLNGMAFIFYVFEF